MSYGSAVIPGRTKTKQKRPARKDSNSSDEEGSSSSDDEPPKQPAQKQKRKTAQSTDSDDPASSGDERRKKQSAKARKTGGSSRKATETKSKPRKSSKKREVSTEEDNSGSSTDDRGYKNKSQGAQKRRRNKWTDANGRENMNKRDRNRKPGGRVLKSGAFPGKGHSLVAVDDLSDGVSTYRRRAGSRNAREARAIAAESRTSATAGRSRSKERTNKATSKKRAKPKPRESSGDEVPKRRKKADTDSEDIDEDSDRPTVKRKSVFDFSDPELRALVGADPDSQVDQLQDSSDEDLPTLRNVVMPSQKAAQSQPNKPVKKDVRMKAVAVGRPKAAGEASGSGRSWTASRDHRDAPVPVKQKRPEQKFFSDAETQKRLKENLAMSAAEKRAAAAKRKAVNTIEIESGDESDENDGLPPRLSRSSGVPSRLKPIKVASKPKSNNTKVIDITDSEAESDSDFD